MAGWGLSKWWCVAFVGLLATAPVAPAVARPAVGIPLRWSFSDPGAPGMSDFGTCRHPACIAFDGGTVVTNDHGERVGTTRYRAFLYPGVGDEVEWDVDETLTTERPICGQWSVHWTGHGTGSPSQTGPDGRFPMHGYLDVSGPGGLAGRLTLDARAAYLTPPGGQDGTIVGRIRCQG